MNKKIFGIRIGTVLKVIICLIAAVAFWILARYNFEFDRDAAIALARSISEGII